MTSLRGGEVDVPSQNGDDASNGTITTQQNQSFGPRKSSRLPPLPNDAVVTEEYLGDLLTKISRFENNPRAHKRDEHNKHRRRHQHRPREPPLHSVPGSSSELFERASTPSSKEPHDEEGRDSPLQAALGQLWDLSVDDGVVKFLVESDSLAILMATIARHCGPQGDRTSELVLGILANIPASRDKHIIAKFMKGLVAGKAALVILFMLMRASDGQTLAELARFFQSVFYAAYSDRKLLDAIFPYITNPDFPSRLTELCCSANEQIALGWLGVLHRIMYLRAWSHADVIECIIATLSSEIVNASLSQTTTRRPMASTELGHTAWDGEDTRNRSSGSGHGGNNSKKKSKTNHGMEKTVRICDKQGHGACESGQGQEGTRLDEQDEDTTPAKSSRMKDLQGTKPTAYSEHTSTTAKSRVTRSSAPASRISLEDSRTTNSLPAKATPGTTLNASICPPQYTSVSSESGLLAEYLQKKPATKNKATLYLPTTPLARACMTMLEEISEIIKSADQQDSAATSAHIGRGKRKPPLASTDEENDLIIPYGLSATALTSDVDDPKAPRAASVSSITSASSPSSTTSQEPLNQRPVSKRAKLHPTIASKAKAAATMSSQNFMESLQTSTPSPSLSSQSALSTSHSSPATSTSSSTPDSTDRESDQQLHHVSHSATNSKSLQKLSQQEPRRRSHQHRHHSSNSKSDGLGSDAHHKVPRHRHNHHNHHHHRHHDHDHDFSHSSQQLRQSKDTQPDEVLHKQRGRHVSIKTKAYVEAKDKKIAQSSSSTDAQSATTNSSSATSSERDSDENDGNDGDAEESSSPSSSSTSTRRTGSDDSSNASSGDSPNLSSSASNGSDHGSDDGSGRTESPQESTDRDGSSDGTDSSDGIDTSSRSRPKDRDGVPAHPNLSAQELLARARQLAALFASSAPMSPSH